MNTYFTKQFIDCGDRTAAACAAGGSPSKCPGMQGFFSCEAIAKIAAFVPLQMAKISGRAVAFGFVSPHAPVALRASLDATGVRSQRLRQHDRGPNAKDLDFATWLLAGHLRTMRREVRPALVKTGHTNGRSGREAKQARTQLRRFIRPGRI